jgi:adenylate cyclase
MAEAAIKYDGVINKYIGDSLMAIFGVPIARETRAEIALDAQHAVRCAIEMRRVLGDLNAAWKAAGKPEIGMRIGINTGPVVAGTLGSLNRLEYTVLGDTVNTASRLESFDKSVAADEACRILISETTLSYLADLTQTERVGAVQLKGKEATVPIYLVH